MKQKLKMTIVMLLCVVILSGCSRIDENTIDNVESVVSSIVDEITPEPTLKEFTSIDIPDNWTIYNADMYDRDTVILMLGNGELGEYQIGFYNLDSGLSTSYKGKLHIEFDDMDYFNFVTLSVQPYVVADMVHEVVYRFSDDFSDVTKVSAYELGSYFYEYNASRDSLIYSVYSDAVCELREYSFITGKDTLFKDFKSEYSYINLDDYYSDKNIGVIGAGELYTNKYVNLLFDFNDMNVIGQYDMTYTIYNGGDDFNLSWFDDSATNISVSSIDIQNETVAPVHLIDMTDSVYSVNAGDFLIGFDADEGSECQVKAYNIETGVLSYESTFDYADYVEIPSTVNFDEIDPMTVYIGSSQKYCYNDGRMLFNLFANDSTYIDTLILWDTSLAEIKDQQLTNGKAIDYPIYEVKERVYYDSNTEYAESIERTYGIEIFYGDSADIEFADYTAELVYDEDMIYFGLASLEEALSLFPDGFFKEFSESGYLRGINFYLCGELTPYNDESISNPAAFTYTDSGYAMVVANVGESSIVSHYCHEIGHVIENRLISEEILDEEVWKEFNPEEFEYNYSYIGEDGNDFEDSASDKYTTWDENYFSEWDAEYIYFIDSYSKTFPTEDRARIFEYAILADEFTFEYFESSHLQAKLEYLSRCIRECWDSSEWGKVPWEKVLAY